jgi:hypothetical protein
VVAVNGCTNAWPADSVPVTVPSLARAAAPVISHAATAARPTTGTNLREIMALPSHGSGACTGYLLTAASTAVTPASSADKL